MAGRGQVSWLPGWSAAPSRGLRVAPSGWRNVRLRLPWPGHSGGTAPASHRTSLDHRPYVRGQVYIALGPQHVPHWDRVTTPAAISWVNSYVLRATRAPAKPSVGSVLPPRR